MLAATKQIIREKKIIAILLAMIVITYLASTLRSSPLPWAISSLVLATVLIGYAWPRWLVRNISVQRTLAERAKEGDSVEIAIDVTNAGTFPRFMMEVVDRMPFDDRGSDGALLAVVAYLAGHRSASMDVRVKADCRGRHKIGPMEVRTGFPLGLIESSIVIQDSVTELVVYPHLFPIQHLPLQANPHLQHLDDLPLPRSTGSAEFVSLRDYQRGDHPKHIHWPSSARLKEIIVKEYANVAAASLTIVPALGKDNNAGKGRESVAEYAIKITGSVAEYASHNGIPVRVILSPPDAADPQLVGDFGFAAILDRLAVVATNTEPAYSINLSHAIRATRPGDNLMVFVTANGTDRQDVADLISEAVAKHINVIAILFDGRTFSGARTGTEDMASIRALVAAPGVTCFEVRQGDHLAALFTP